MRRRSPLLYVFLCVPLAYLVALIGFPIAYNLVMSLQEVNLGNIDTLARPFLGLDNYLAAINDPTFRKVFVNTVVFAIANVVGQVGIGGLVAICFARNFAGAHYFRGLLLAAWLLPGLVVGTVWKWLFASQFGVINYVLSRLGLISEPVHWLSDPSKSMTALNICHIWFGMPFSMILIAAALTNISNDLYEAAALDGAGPFARFRYVTLPAISPALLAVACLVTISSLRSFDVIFAMTHGGPLDSTNVLPLLSYTASFEDFDFGRGAAIGMFAFVVVFLVALVYVRTVSRESET